LLDLLSGIAAPQAGRITLGGRAIDREHPADPAEMRQLGLAHVPEDRQHRGLVLNFSAAENAVLGYHRGERAGPGRLLSPSALRALCQRLMERFDVRPTDPSLRAGGFSGGNQQKMVLAREIDVGPKVLLVGQPTRGVDIGAIEFINQQLIDLKRAGCAILLVSVELDEILALSDRIMVMNAGRIVGTVARTEADRRRLGLMMAGVADEAAA
jgi:simple sugar transport system ATP-binding protein